jgi:hypothetical protein
MIGKKIRYDNEIGVIGGRFHYFLFFFPEVDQEWLNPKSVITNEQFLTLYGIPMKYLHKFCIVLDMNYSNFEVQVIYPNTELFRRLCKDYTIENNNLIAWKKFVKI